MLIKIWKDFIDILEKIITNQRIVPFTSGAVAINILNNIITNGKLQGTQYNIAICSCLFVFFTSLIAYTYLSKIEKDKDAAMLDMTKRIIEAVFKHFGVKMAENNAGETGKVMNPIMQTIVTLVQEFQKLADKGYKN